ncbi:hypothetical protein AK812_SmicGene43361 [Symbiodinium microadriaticum]|uniref:Uncharacterized protein n=1 Tax=Symbiodinium microadriaticum TaxID=2951 RepID=A0A1Q9C180_SYMMI|nr:hypothetical protein AK812_SmicGene43361 [Symbiodinium microadriaticum]CAE7228086.1 unnamed protein product [Symbiodinium microadriaticum]
MGSRSAYKICAKLSWLTGWGSPVLLSPEQQEQLRRMEQRAPLLYGPPRAERPAEGNGSSGGSNYEAVQEEVKRQLRGVVSQLEASRREAQDLREEVEFLRAAREQSNANQRLEDQGLRQWLRHYQRARDLKLSDNPEVALRMNLLRFHLKVDFSPTEESALALRRALLAEFEQMGFKKKAKRAQGLGPGSFDSDVAFVNGKGGKAMSCFPAGYRVDYDRDVQGVPVGQLIEDAQKLMQAFMEQKTQPMVQALRVDEAAFSRDCRSPALREFMKQNDSSSLDSGATHPLRARTDQDQNWGHGQCQRDLSRRKPGTDGTKQVGAAEGFGDIAAKEHKEKSWKDHVQDYVTSGAYEDWVKAVMCAPFMHRVPMKDQLQTIVPL